VARVRPSLELNHDLVQDIQGSLTFALKNGELVRDICPGHTGLPSYWIGACAALLRGHGALLFSSTFKSRDV